MSRDVPTYRERLDAYRCPLCGHAHDPDTCTLAHGPSADPSGVYANGEARQGSQVAPSCDPGAHPPDGPIRSSHDEAGA